MIRHKPVDVWSVKEKLSLASSVKRNGDQNWVSVSRAIRPFSEPRRPPDWFNQKNCALQYADMLDKVETPKRKRGDQGVAENPQDQIIRNLTIERIEELKRLVQQEQSEYKKIKAEKEAVFAGEYDDKIKEKLNECQAEEKAKEEKNKQLDIKAAEEAAARAAAAAAAKAALKPAIPGLKKPLIPIPKITGGITTILPEPDESTQDSILSEPISVDVMTDDEFNINTPSITPSCTPKPTPPASPFLSSLLQKFPESISSSAAPSVKSEPDKEDESINIDQDFSVEITGYDDDDETTAGSVANSDSTPVDIKTEPLPTPSPAVSTLTKLLVSPKSKLAAPKTTSTPNVPKTSAEIEKPSPVTKSMLKSSSPPSTPSLAKKSSSSSTPIKVIDPPPASTSAATRTSASTTATPAAKQPQSSPSKKQNKPGKITDDESQDGISSDIKKEEDISLIKQDDEKVGDKTEDKIDDSISTAMSDSIIDISAIDDSVIIKEEPASPASSVSSKISEVDNKTGRRRSGRSSIGYKNRAARRSSRSTRTTRSDKKDGDSDSSDDDTVPDSDDVSLSKLTVQPGSLFIESVPNSPASLSQCSDTEDDKVYKTWKKSIMLVWRAAANHKYANVFLHPVSDDIAPGYSSVVFRPKDLHTIKKHIETGVLKTTAEFQRDIMLMFTNALMYNNSDHNVFKMAQEMYDDVMQHIEQYVNTQLMLQATETKTLRGARRSEASDKEDDTKKRKTSTDQDNTGGKSKRRKTRADD